MNPKICRRKEKWKGNISVIQSEKPFISRLQIKEKLEDVAFVIVLIVFVTTGHIWHTAIQSQMRE